MDVKLGKNPAILMKRPDKSLLCAGQPADNRGMENLSLHTGSPAVGNGRRHPRYPIQLPILVREEVPGKGQADTVLLRDISLTGFYFASSRPYPAESRLDIQVAFGAREYQIKALVQRSEEAPKGAALAYGIAVLFLRGGDIHAFIADVATYLQQLPADLTPA